MRPNKSDIPDVLREQLRAAGKARASRITHAQRVAYGRKAWQTRVRNASEKARRT